MSPSQIVKSACPAGYTLKSFARQVVADHKASPELIDACKKWLAMKADQHKQARKCRRGFNDVHAQQHNRSMQHCAGKGTPVFVREGGRS